MNCLQELKFKIEDNFLFYLRNSEIRTILKYRPELYNLIESSICSSSENKTSAVLMILTFLGYNKTEDLDSERIFRISSILELITLLSVLEEDAAPEAFGTPDRDSSAEKFSGSEFLTVSGMLSAVILDHLMKLQVNESSRHRIVSIYSESNLNFYKAKLKQSLLKNKIPGINLNNLFEIYDMKTMQLFSVPMLISAVLSGSTQDFEHLKKSASCFGRAFQIVKEINTFSADKVLDYNIVSALLWKNASADEKKELRKLYASVRNPDNLSETAPVIHKIKKYDILRKAAGYAHDFKETGISALINTRIQDNVQDDIADFIESLIVVKLPGI